MPIISKIGSRSWKVQLVYGFIFAILTIGALSMIYPFMLMLSGSVKSEVDSVYITPYPRFWFDNTALFQKYAESKYGERQGYAELEAAVAQAWRIEVPSYRKIKCPEPAKTELLEEFRQWMNEYDMPVEWYQLGHSRLDGIMTKNDRDFKKLMYKKFHGDIDAYKKEMEQAHIYTWLDAGLPPESILRTQYSLTGLHVPFNEFKKTRRVEDRCLFNLDGQYYRTFLVPRYTNEIAEYNRQHGTKYASDKEVYLTRRVPKEKGLVRQDWENYVRGYLQLRFIRIDAKYKDTYRNYLAEKRYKNIEEYNNRYKTNYKSFGEIHVPLTMSTKTTNYQEDWESFIKDAEACPVEALEVYGPRQGFEEFAAKKRGAPLEQVAPLDMPIYQYDYEDAMARKWEFRREFSTRNYIEVFYCIAQHGRGIINTVIYCSLAIVTALLVNPLAAYALSRYKPPATYKIILFCMATMAFPLEVTMIPNFLLLKRFPLWPLIGGGIAFGAAIWLISRFAPRLSEGIRMLLSLVCGLFVAAAAVPCIIEKPSVSLINTYAALVLPSVANGYFIFLLKGFFDSLPRELYEAADIDGAGEWTKFWTITMSLSKPILAVIALSAFTDAYSNFMMALILIPDRKMWTIMVWIFQMQAQSHQAVVYASLVIAAIPTFFVFVFCQNIIMRGIVVPVEK